MFYSLLINKVPDNWKKYAYPSLKPLNSWIKDLYERVNFIRNWFLEGTVNSYWMSSFFFPQGFLTGVLQ
jgi:dynein heavy chain